MNLFSLGGYISKFSEDAAEHHKEIVAGLDIITSPNNKKGDPAVDDAKATVRNNLRKLTRKAEDTQTECVKLGEELSIVSHIDPARFTMTQTRTSLERSPKPMQKLSQVFTSVSTTTYQANLSVKRA